MPDRLFSGITMRQVLPAAALWLAGSSLLAIVLTAQEGLHFVWAFRTSGWQCAVLVVLMLGAWRLLPWLERLPAGLRIAMHLVLASTVVVVWEVVFEALLSVLAGVEVATLRREVSGYWRWLQAASLYGVVMAGMIVVRTNRRLRVEERKAGEFRLLMREAELRALRAQLRPHFLFNALNSVSGLIRAGDSPGALGAVAAIGDLLRTTLDSDDEHEIRVDEEVDIPGFEENYCVRFIRE